MQVRILAFGVLKDLLGTGTCELELLEAATVADLLRILEQQTSNLSMQTNVWRSLAVAVNREYSSVSRVLREADEVALLPPVSGGLRRHDAG